MQLKSSHCAGSYFNWIWLTSAAITYIHGCWLGNFTTTMRTT
jgi:hypothetical protein